MKWILVVISYNDIYFSARATKSILAVTASDTYMTAGIRFLIFPAGNEYRRFEIIDRKAITMGIEKMYFDNNFYCAQVNTDTPRKNYLYDQDQNGRFLIRNSEDLNNDSESDYIFTDFKLKMPKLNDGKIYLYGDFTGEQLNEDYEMEYNDQRTLSRKRS